MESDETIKKNPVQNSAPFYSIPPFSLSNPVFIVTPTEGRIDDVGQSISTLSTNNLPSIVNLNQPSKNVNDQSLDLQTLQASIQSHPNKSSFCNIPTYQGNILSPVPIKPAPIKPAPLKPARRGTGKRALLSKSKQIVKQKVYTTLDIPQLPPQLSAQMIQNASEGNSNVKARSRKNKVEKKDNSCQTSGWKFMSEIGTIEAMRDKNNNREKQTSKSTIIASLKSICRNFKEKVELMNYNTKDSHWSVMKSVVDECSRWLKQHTNKANTCLLCEQRFLSEKSLNYHFVSTCAVLKAIFVENVVGINQSTHPDNESVRTDSLNDKNVSPSIVQDLFSKSYFHNNNVHALKGVCMFCGEDVKCVETANTDMYLDKRHFFDSCIVFRSFLLFHNQPYIHATSQKVGTSWTFLYYFCLLNYYALDFEHDLNDLRFLKEDKARLILVNMENITDNIIQRAVECPLCYSPIKNHTVLKHHISFALCPFLLKFYKDMKLHIQNVWKTPGQVEHLRRITICFQSFMQFQESPKPMMLKQSILEESLACKLLENAVYFKSLDNNFTLQFYKTPKDAAVALKIEELQQHWAEEVLKGREDSTECPFCLTVFNTEKNLLKHIVYISCKSIRPLCNQIYSLIEYCEWDVLSPLNILTQHSSYIIKQAILRGKFEINLIKDHLSEYITLVIEKFLNLDLTEKVKDVMFEGTECESLQLKGELTVEEESIFQEFYTWAKKVIKKKNGSVCPLCGHDESDVNFTNLTNHLALGACTYLKQFLCLMDEVYKFNHLFKPCPAPTKIVINNNRSVSFDFVHHIRKVLFLFKASTKSKSNTFFDHAEFEDFLVNSPQNYIKHSNLISFVIGNETSTCSFCFMDLKSQDHLLLHLLFFKCPTIMFVINLVKNEWKKCSMGSMGKTDKMLDIIKVYSSIFELDPRAVISSSNMKKYFNENNNVAMLNNFKHLKAWAQEMFTFDASSNLNICNACNVAAELIDRHLWFEEPVENFCPELKSYLDFHRKMVCKKDKRGEIQASFTVTDLFELKRFIQCQYSHMSSRSAILDVEKQAILSPTLKKEVKDSINMTLKIYPRYDGTLESFKLMYGTSPAFLGNQIAIADKIAVSKMCLLCDIMFLSVEDVRYHLATFECRILQNILHNAKSADQIDNEIMKNELINAYKRTVAFCREQYPNLNEGNLLMVTETVDSECHSKLYNFILSKIPRINPYKCCFCYDSFSSKGEIYTHYKKIQCLGLRECFGFIPNKGPVGIRNLHPFLQVVYEIFLNCYTSNSIRSICKLQKTLMGVSNLADMYEFWCSSFCDSFVPECCFCGMGLISVSVIKSHPMTCSKLRELNLEVFRSDRLQDSTFMKQQGLGSCKLTGDLPREIAKESEGVPFMQRYRCSQYLNWIPLCLDCATSSSTSDSGEGASEMDEETCRFLLFRRLVKKDNRLLVFDFESCQSVANIASWVPSRNTVPGLEVECAKYILRHCLPHFNQMMTTELWELENLANIRMKHQVSNVRELCDSCSTTLFNIHLFCPRCGYVICMDCYRDRLAGYVSAGLTDCSDGSAHNITSLETCVTIPPRAVKLLCGSVEAIKDMHCISVTNLPFTICPTDEIPHELICNGQVLALKEGQNPRNTAMFQKFHQKGNAVVVHGHKGAITTSLWTPESFSKHFGHERERVINTTTLEVHRISLKDFFDGFENVNERPRNENGDPMVLKLKDWPTTWDFKEKLPQWYDDFMKVLPMKHYTHRDGLYNIARYLPNIYCTPDLGPKMYIAYSNANNPNEGSTVLHIDISDAVNIIMYVGQTQDVVINYDDDVTATKTESTYLKRKVYSLKDICEDTDDKQLERIRRDRCKLGALWHIFHPNDIDKIRHFIHKVLNENGQTLPSGHDPIHDQAMYLDKDMRKRLFQEYGVKGWPIAQCEGDAVMIPAGAPHQVRNLQSCIKIAEDFVSPERVSFCLKHTLEIRHLSKNHLNQEDKLQIKNLLYHGVKECVSVLQNHPPAKEVCTCAPISVLTDSATVGTQFCAGPVRDSRDLTIERLKADLDNIKMSGAAEKKAFKELLDSQQADCIKAKRYYELEKQTNTNLKAKITNLLKHQEHPPPAQRLNPPSSSQTMPMVKVVAMPYGNTMEHGRSQQPESHIQELRKPEPRHPQLRTSDSRHSSDHSKHSEPRTNDIRSSDSRQRSSSASSAEKRKRPLKFKQYEPPAQVTKQPPPHQEPSTSEPIESSDPRLKPKMVEAEDKPANASDMNNNSWDLRFDKSKPVLVTPNVVPRSAFQGVQHAVQDLRKKHPPPQKIRKTPETPEPMDTNQDSCSPGPTTSGLYPTNQTNNLQMLSAVSAVQSRSFGGGKGYDQGASNSETDSNEEVPSQNYQMFPSNFPPPPGKSAVLSGPLNSSPSVSPGFNQKSLNLQISSPKQPAIFSKQAQGGKKSTYQKIKDEILSNPKQSQSIGKPSTLSEIFPLQPPYNNTYSTARAALISNKKPIKTELRTPPSDKIVNHPTFAPHLASYLPDMLTRSCTSDRLTWNTDPKKTVASPVTPTMSPCVVSRAVSSPVTPSPPSHRESNQHLAMYVTPPTANVVPPPKTETTSQPSCAVPRKPVAHSKIDQIRTPLLLKSPKNDTIPVPRQGHSVTYGTRGRTKSNESFASLSSSSPDVSDAQTQPPKNNKVQISLGAYNANHSNKQPTHQFSKDCSSKVPKSPNSFLDEVHGYKPLISPLTQTNLTSSNIILDEPVAISSTLLNKMDLIPLEPDTSNHLHSADSNAPSASRLSLKVENDHLKEVNDVTPTASDITPIQTIINKEIPITASDTAPAQQDDTVPIVKEGPSVAMKSIDAAAPNVDNAVQAQVGIEEPAADSSEVENTSNVVLDPPRDPRLARYQGNKPSVEPLKHQDETVTSSNEAGHHETNPESKSESAPGNCDAKVSSTTNNSSEESISEAQRRKYCQPEPDKLIIFDETLISRLSKKRNPSSQGEAGEVSGASSEQQSKIINPLLRNRSTPAPPPADKLLKKTRLTDTVDAILKSDKVTSLPRESTTLTEHVPALGALSGYTDIVSPVISAVAGVSRIIKRSRESSGNSASSITNMPVLSPISPASTPPTTTEQFPVLKSASLLAVESPPPLPIESPPQDSTPPSEPPLIAVKTSPRLAPFPKISSATSTLSSPELSIDFKNSETDTFGMSRKRRCSKANYRKRSPEPGALIPESGENAIAVKAPVCKRYKETESAVKRDYIHSKDDLKSKRDAIRAALQSKTKRSSENKPAESSAVDDESVKVENTLPKAGKNRQDHKDKGAELDKFRVKENEEHFQADQKPQSSLERIPKMVENCGVFDEKSTELKEDNAPVKHNRIEVGTDGANPEKKRSKKGKKSSKKKTKRSKSCDAEHKSTEDGKPSVSVARDSGDEQRTSEGRSSSQETKSSRISRESRDSKRNSRHRSSTRSPSRHSRDRDSDNSTMKKSRELSHRHSSRRYDRTSRCHEDDSRSQDDKSRSRDNESRRQDSESRRQGSKSPRQDSRHREKDSRHNETRDTGEKNGEPSHDSRRYINESRFIQKSDSVRKNESARHHEGDLHKSDSSRSRDSSTRQSRSNSPDLAKQSGRKVTITQLYKRSPKITRTVSGGPNQKYVSRHRKSKRRR